MKVAREWYSQGTARYIQEGGDPEVLLIVDPEFVDLEGMGRANRGQERVRDWVRSGISMRHRVWKRDKGQDQRVRDQNGDGLMTTDRNWEETVTSQLRIKNCFF